jgi:Domain of unknown function DUF11
VRNVSALAANDVRVTISIPSLARLMSVRSSAGSCTRGRTSICRVGRLGANAAATITVRTKPSRAGVVLVRFAVLSTTPEAAPRDNAATVRTTIGRRKR